MLAKLSLKNQLTLPKAAVDTFCDVTHFLVEVHGDRLVLTPVRQDEVARLNAVEAEVADCAAWAAKFR
jgi:hypothetical protein